MSAFALSLAKFAKEAPERVDEVVRKVSTDVLARVVMRTPVGNPDLWKGKAPAGYVGGRARASWGVGLNRPAEATVTLTDRNGQTTIVRGHAALSAYKPGDSVWITSRLPYIHALEYGHSKQAPAGMVRITVTEFQTFVDRAVASLPK